MPARPGYPVSPGGAPAVFRNTGVGIQGIHTGGFTAGGAWRRKSRASHGAARVPPLLAWRAACTQWRPLCARMLGRVNVACLPAIASAFACSCAWLVCSVFCAKCALMSNAGSIVHHMVWGMRACWMKLNQ